MLQHITIPRGPIELAADLHLPDVSSEAARDRAFAALANAFDRRLAKITPRDRNELQRILLALLDPATDIS